MASFIIEGGHRLQGEITPQGAKNEALQILCATLLTSDEVTIENVPDISDVNNLISLLQDIGCKVSCVGERKWTFKAEVLDREYLCSEQFRARNAALRGSVMLIGPLLARLGFAIAAKPGGDKIGRRHLDTHFEGFAKLGARFDYDPEVATYNITADRLRGTDILMWEASVTGTANIIMAAVTAKGRTQG